MQGKRRKSKLVVVAGNEWEQIKCSYSQNRSPHVFILFMISVFGNTSELFTHFVFFFFFLGVFVFRLF
jgi:hypothetical protein